MQGGKKRPENKIDQIAKKRSINDDDDKFILIIPINQSINQH